MSSAEPSKHRPEHRDAQGVPPDTSFSKEGPLPSDPRSDRRKYLVPDQHLPTVLEACRRGVPETRIARGLGVNYRTWMRLRAEDERLAGALAETRKMEEEELVSLLMDKARGGELSAIIFALKGRHAYRDVGQPVGATEQKVNVVINLPAAKATAEDYMLTMQAA